MNSSQSIRDFTFANGSTIPVGTFYCIGRNYSAHAKEMGAEVPTSPLVFLKPPSAYLPFDGALLHCPDYSHEMHHEVEIALVIGEDIPMGMQTGFASYVAGYGIALDLTLRDVQSRAKSKGEPWAVSKGFAGSAPVSVLFPSAEFPHLTFSLTVNGEIRQKGDTAMMERDFDALIGYCHSIFSLRKGDCILTGTPEGVGQLYSGDILVATIDGQLSSRCTIA